MTQITFIALEEPPAAAPSGGFALWQLGFRPFYLLASLFAALSIPVWALQYAGVLGTPYLHGPLWHAHEMLFGFMLAVMVGRLLPMFTNHGVPGARRGAAAAAAGHDGGGTGLGAALVGRFRPVCVALCAGADPPAPGRQAGLTWPD